MSRKFILLFFLLSFLFQGIVQGEENWTNEITPEITLEAIKIFRENPMGTDARGALSLVVNYAQNSDDVTITLLPKYLPWQAGSLGPNLEGIFLGAFVAGNVEHQLITNRKENRPLEGIQLMLDSYQMLKDRKKIDPIETFETWLEYTRAGTLKDELGL